MNYVGQIFEFIQKLVIWWVTIMPWEKAVHVRMGKQVRVLGAGIHIRIPFIDRVYVQTTRLRVVQCPVQTVTTKDGKTVTISMNLGYTIEDIYKLYSTLFQADQTISNMMHGITADEVFSKDLIDCTPTYLEQATKERMKGEDFGLHFEYIKITGFAVVKTYRLIQDSSWGGVSHDLETDKQKA